MAGEVRQRGQGNGSEMQKLLTCIECGVGWPPGDQTRWRIYLTPTEPPEAVVYCEACAAREFDG